MTAVAEDFLLPAELEAAAPPEHRGLERDQVRLLVARPDHLEHATFRDLTRFLDPGDLLVVNTSAMVPAAFDATRGDGRPAVVHLARPVTPGTWAVELRRPDHSGPARDGRAGERVRLPAGGELTLLGPYPTGAPEPARLWRARLRTDGPSRTAS